MASPVDITAVFNQLIQILPWLLLLMLLPTLIRSVVEAVKGTTV